MEDITSPVGNDESNPVGTVDSGEILGDDTNSKDKSQVDQDSRVIHIEFDDEQKEELTKLIETEIIAIKAEYDAEDYYTKLQNAKDNFNSEPNEEASSNGDYDIRIPIQKLITRVLVTRAIRQTFQSDPIVLMEREGPISDDDLHTRENKLDFTLRNMVKYEELCNSIYEHAIYEPVCITKTIEYHDEDEVTTIQTYQPTANDIARFDKDFGILDPMSPEGAKRNELLSGKSVTVPVTETKVLYSGPKVYRVDNERFFAHPKQKDFRKQRVVAEQLDYSWVDIEMRSKSKKYKWNADAVKAIKEKYGEDYFKVSIPFFEATVLYNKNGDDNYKRYIITMEVKTRQIVRSVLYTNEEIAYTSHSINPKDDSWIGESLMDMINEIVNIVCANFNYMLHSNDLFHTPVILTSDPDGVTRKAIDLGIVNVIPFAKDSTFQQITLSQSGFDMVGFIQTLFDLIYMLSGVNVQTISGGDTSKDPRAGVGKTALKQQVTNLRIEDMIMRLQYSDVQVCEKVEKIMYSMSGDKLNYWNKDKEVKVNKEAYGFPVRYVMNGSKMTFNRDMDLEMIMKFLGIVQQLSPATLADDSVRRDILDVVIQDIGGSISRMKDKIMAGLDAYIKVKKTIQQTQQQGQEPQGQPAPSEPIQSVGMPGVGNSTPALESGMPQNGGQ